MEVNQNQTCGIFFFFKENNDFRRIQPKISSVILPDF